MEYLDFLSSPPSFSIFQKKTNKIKFGGILFLIYLIIMLFICLIYILDFILNEKFDIQCLTSYSFENYLDENEKDLNKIPDVSVEFEIVVLDQPINKLIIKTNEGEYISGIDGFHFIKNISKIPGTRYEIIYQCENSNCSDLYVSKEAFAFIGHKRFYIDNYNSTPIQFYDNEWYGVRTFLKENNLLNLNVYWTPIIYKDLKGISRLFDRFFNNVNEYSVGFVDVREYEYSPIFYNNDNKSQPVIAIIDNYSSKKFIEYRRKEIGFMDILAKIGALFSTFNFVFITIFKFYENNFNNYKIVNKILQPIKIKKDIIINKNEKEENKIENVISPLLNKDDDNNKEAKDIEIINTINDEQLEDTDVDKNNFNKKEDKNRGLPKISFLQYFLNNIYCRCCRKNKKQELIDICNNIVLKYTSIDYILLNQIKLENLLKDYKWNDPSLNDIKNNEIIIRLKNNT